PVLRGGGPPIRHSSLHGSRIPPRIGGDAAEALRPSLPRHLRPGLVRAVGLQGAVAGETGRRAGATPCRQGSKRVSLGRDAVRSTFSIHHVTALILTLSVTSTGSWTHAEELKRYRDIESFKA